jgi:hypothetical protein
VVHWAVGTSLVSVRNWLQPPQFCDGTAAAGGAGLGVWPEPGSGVAPAIGNGSADCPATNKPNDSSVELNGLRRDMAVNRCTFEYPSQREKVTP